MRIMLTAFSLFITLMICEVQVFADNIQRADDPDAYPKGYYSGDPLPAKTAYLTFDDGPSDWTEGILDVLKSENIKATFFICAYWNNRKMKGINSFRKHKKSLLRTVREGHILGNHTSGHRVLTRLSPDEIREQFSLNQYYLDKVLGKETRLMTIIRPPLGYPWYRNKPLSVKIRVGKVIKKIGIVALWTREFDSTDSWDWAKGEWYRRSSRVDNRDPSFLRKRDRVFSRIMENADGRGMVILMHDTHLVTKDILFSVIKELKRRGYVFRTMEDFVVWKYDKGSRELLGVK